ncbi:MAG: hypothetical protein ABI972_24200 [Acidobacteriota bacterium]
MARPIILLGATGLTGRHAAQFLLADPRCSRLLAPTRRAIGLDHPKLEPLPLNPGSPALPPLPNAVFLCCLGSTIKKAGSQENFRRIDHDLPLAYARAALAAGATHAVLVSSVGASPKSSNFYLRVKGDLESTLAQLPFAALDIFRPSLLLGDRPDRRLAERIASPLTRAIAPLLLGPLSIYRPIQAATLAQALVATALADPPPIGSHIHHWRDITRPSTAVY